MGEWLWPSRPCREPLVTRVSEVETPTRLHVSFRVTLSRLNVWRSSPRIFEEKRDCLQFDITRVSFFGFLLVFVPWLCQVVHLSCARCLCAQRLWNHVNVPRSYINMETPKMVTRLKWFGSCWGRMRDSRLRPFLASLPHAWFKQKGFWRIAFM